MKTWTLVEIAQLVLMAETLEWMHGQLTEAQRNIFAIACPSPMTEQDARIAIALIDRTLAAQPSGQAERLG